MCYVLSTFWNPWFEVHSLSIENMLQEKVMVIEFGESQPSPGITCSSLNVTLRRTLGKVLGELGLGTKRTVLN